MGYRIPVAVVLIVTVTACGGPDGNTPSVRPPATESRVVDLAVGGELIPGSGQAVGAGHAVVYGSDAVASNGSGRPTRSSTST